MFATAVCYLPTNEPFLFPEESFPVWNLSSECETNELLEWLNDGEFDPSYSVRVFYH